MLCLGESIAVEAAIAVRRGHVVAVEYKPGDRQTMEENVVRFGLNNVLIVDDMESYSHRWPVPDVAFLVASPKLELELQTLVRVNPKIRVVIYTLEFSFMSRIPRMLWENGIQPTEVMQLEVSRWAGRTRSRCSRRPGFSLARRGRNNAQEKGPFFREKRGICALTRPRPVRIISSIKQSQSQWR